MLLNSFFLCLGIALLYWGSEWMVKGAASLALSLSIRPLIVGLTVVAFATSAPELLVSLVAAVKGSSGMSLGNILGSNVANIALILGLSALFSPLAVDPILVRRDIPFLVGISALFWVLCLNGQLGLWKGILLVTMLIVFILMGVFTASTHSQGKETLPVEKKGTLWKDAALIVAGTTALMGGAHLVVQSSIFFAKIFGLSETFIGLSIVAVGTSLPELATSVAAAAHRESDISIGNVVGSNVFNLCLVMGAVGVFNPMEVDRGLLRFEFPAMFVLTLLLWIFARTRLILGRREGVVFVVCYLAFVGLSYWRAIL
ncbi:calcium/sodium antiporter [Desulfatiglans anilini]|uniref:calcium/sodium antiporter n=1 Tax=Desulfatiglans anilini TaxID=90728 RepID=UPI000416AF26|nr:calcium/sodium antiporter [Desulfatiglans anilini]